MIWNAGRLRILIMVGSSALCACTTTSGLKPFASDGCSLFPDRSLLSEADWCACCFEHDLAYWRGGTAEEREAADRRLQKCVVETTQNQNLADLMYAGVRVGGSPYFYDWYRWGYGWSFERKYQALNDAEKAKADHLQQQYFESNNDKVCAH